MLFTFLKVAPLKRFLLFFHPGLCYNRNSIFRRISAKRS